MSAAAVESRELREYEMIYILRSSATGEEAGRVDARVRDVMTRMGGTLTRVDNWGRRKLAYPIAKSVRGVFVLIGFVAPSDLVVELERTLGLLESVIRTQTILTKRRVSLADYKIEAEEVAMAPLEDEPESEEPTLASRLGLVDRPKPPRDNYGDSGEYGGSSQSAREGADAAPAAAKEADEPKKEADEPKKEAPAATEAAAGEEDAS